MKAAQRATSCRWEVRTLALIEAFIAVSALAGVVDIEWDASGHFERTLSVAPRKFAEVCGKLSAGSKVHWHFVAITPMDFNVHYHVGKDVVFPSKLTDVAMAQGTLDAKLDQDYCWMWSNKSAAAATLTISLSR